MVCSSRFPIPRTSVHPLGPCRRTPTSQYWDATQRVKGVRFTERGVPTPPGLVLGEEVPWVVDVGPSLDVDTPVVGVAMCESGPPPVIVSILRRRRGRRGVGAQGSGGRREWKLVTVTSF